MKRVFVFTIVACICFASSCITPCNNEIISENYCESKIYKSVVYLRGCGATTEDSTQVSVINGNGKLKNISGNVFVKSGKGFVETSWIDHKTLLIKYKYASKIFKQMEKWHEIKIEYGSLD